MHIREQVKARDCPQNATSPAAAEIADGGRILRDEAKLMMALNAEI
jgi:hypothetical protein